MSTNRRKFLAGLGMAGAAVGAGAMGSNPAFAATASAEPVQAPAKKPVYPTFKGIPSVLDQFSRASFAQHVGSTFRVTARDADGLETAVDLKLTETEDGVGNDPANGYECFSLTFTGPAARPLAQSTYPFSHAKMGKFDMFIVPIGQDKEIRTYEAVFTRLARG